MCYFTFTINKWRFAFQLYLFYKFIIKMMLRVYDILFQQLSNSSTSTTTYSLYHLWNLNILPASRDLEYSSRVLCLKDIKWAVLYGMTGDSCVLSSVDSFSGVCSEIPRIRVTLCVTFPVPGITGDTLKRVASWFHISGDWLSLLTENPAGW